MYTFLAWVIIVRILAVFYEDGVVKTYKRERPKLVQDAKGAIVGLANGIGVELVDAFQAGDDCACTLVARVAS